MSRWRKVYGIVCEQNKWNYLQMCKRSGSSDRLEPARAGASITVTGYLSAITPSVRAGRGGTEWYYVRYTCAECGKLHSIRMRVTWAGSGVAYLTLMLKKVGRGGRKGKRLVLTVWPEERHRGWFRKATIELMKLNGVRFKGRVSIIRA